MRRFHEPANHVSFAHDMNCDLNADESMLASMNSTDAAKAPLDLPVDGIELATYVAAKLCHDFISPSGASLAASAATKAAGSATCSITSIEVTRS